MHAHRGEGAAHGAVPGSGSDAGTEIAGPELPRLGSRAIRTGSRIATTTSRASRGCAPGRIGPGRAASRARSIAASAVSSGSPVSVDRPLAGSAPLGERSTWRGRETLLAALNGVLGDYLAASGNPLAITMRLRRRHPPAGRARRAAIPASDRQAGRA